ncbi:MAG: hypothetical protein ACREB3_00030 [Burkholderiales bacterium]
MLQYTQMEPRFLWSVTQSGAVTNERVAGITPANPIVINTNFIGALFHLRVVNRVNITLGNVIVYGTLHTSGGAAPFYFPVAASPNAERLVTFGTNPATNEGALRNPMGADVDGATTKQTLALIPNALLLEYTTSAPGVGPVVTFQVWASFIGPMVAGVQ